MNFTIKVIILNIIGFAAGWFLHRFIKKIYKVIKK
jgi:glycopeptide antibiotics resistance protein